MKSTTRSLVRLVAAAAALSAGAVFAAELRPLVTPPFVTSTSPTAEQRAALERYYQDFTLEARYLTPQQRVALAASFEAQRRAAERDGRAGEMAHYARLLDILNRPGP